MKRMTKTVSSGATRSKKLCCEALRKQKTEIESYIVQLIKAREDVIKTKWAWGIIKAIEPLSGEKSAKKNRSLLCEQCESYIAPRKRLAELVIVGSKG